MLVLSFDMGTRNLAFSLIQSPNRIVKMGVIDLLKNSARSAADVLLDSLCRGGENDWMPTCSDEFVVESQPSNSASKILSFVLMTYFRTFDEVSGNPVRPFRFMAAGQKFKLYPAVFEQMRPETYEDRKRTAQQMAMKVFEENDPQLVQFYRGQNPKRKTDLADAIVQGCQHIKEKEEKAKKKKTK